VGRVKQRAEDRQSKPDALRHLTFPVHPPPPFHYLPPPSNLAQLEAKTRKLKKVWQKLQSAQTEIRDLATEFQKEREDMLDTIRELNKALKLKQVLLDAFVPREEADRIESRAIWDEEADEWSLMRLELAGNRIRVRRPPSTLSPA
jgi:hypothetical protein